MKKLIIAAIISLATVLLAGEYVFPQPVPVWAEETVRIRQVQAVSITVEQASLLRLKDGSISARATVSVFDGSNTFCRVVAVDEKRVGEVIGTNRTVELVASLDEIFAAVLAAESP